MKLNKVANAALYMWLDAVMYKSHAVQFFGALYFSYAVANILQIDLADFSR
jgi:hypothetical protein